MSNKLKNKTIILGITGGIAAYKCPELVRLLVKDGADVHCILTDAGQKFMTPLTLQTLSGNPVHTDMFRTHFKTLRGVISPCEAGVGNPAEGGGRGFPPPKLPHTEKLTPKQIGFEMSSSLIQEKEIGHISLADKANIIIVAPATADIIAKVACGICDELLTTVICATKAPVVFAPSMNSNMWKNPITQDNVKRLKKYGYHIIEPETGELACGYEGKGRLPELEVILKKVISFL